jgi:hypothetical protein
MESIFYYVNFIGNTYNINPNMNVNRNMKNVSFKGHIQERDKNQNNMYGQYINFQSFRSLEGNKLNYN